MPLPPAQAPASEPGNVERRHQADALEAWRGLRAVATDSYGIATAPLVSALRANDVNHDAALLSREIDRVLRHELRRWVDFSYDRLKHFGYFFDTY